MIADDPVRYPQKIVRDHETAAASGRAARLDQAGLVGEDHRLDPVAQAELGQDPADMRLHGGLGDEQPAGDLGVGQAAGDEGSTSRSRAVKQAGPRGRPSRPGTAGEPVDQPAGRAGATTASPECTARMLDQQSAGGRP